MCVAVNVGTTFLQNSKILSPNCRPLKGRAQPPPRSMLEYRTQTQSSMPPMEIKNRGGKRVSDANFLADISTARRAKYRTATPLANSGPLWCVRPGMFKRFNNRAITIQWMTKLKPDNVGNFRSFTRSFIAELTVQSFPNFPGER